MRIASLILLGLLTVCCRDDSDCLAGKYIDGYCEGIAILLLDDSKLGVDWSNSSSSSYMHENVVIASIDSSLNIEINEFIDLIGQDSIIYFTYREGGYPQKQYKLCYPPPFITITYFDDTRICN